MSLSVIIPSLGLTALLRFCILQLQQSVRAAELERWSIVVVDNATPQPYRPNDLSSEPALRVLRFDRAASFAKACNDGARLAPAESYLFLNNDVLLHPLALREMLALSTRQDAAICGTRLVYPDDTIQHCGVRFDGGARGPYHWRHHAHTSTVARDLWQYQAVTAAAVWIENGVFQALGGFDESFPFGYEDVDFCLRARQQGHTVACSQAVDSIHFGSTTSRAEPAHYEASRTAFFTRWGGKFCIDGKETDP